MSRDLRRNPSSARRSLDTSSLNSASTVATRRRSPAVSGPRPMSTTSSGSTAVNSTRVSSQARAQRLEPPLRRHGTLLSSGATPTRRAAELKSLLGNANCRLRPGASVPSHPRASQQPTLLEQAKVRARVEVDLLLNSSVFVEGGDITGVIKLRVRPRLAKEPLVLIGDGKLRVLGFETGEGDDHHEFYQHSVALCSAAPSMARVYTAQADWEGFRSAQEGVHRIEFTMGLPLGQATAPKGPFRGNSGASVRYIVLVSLKVKDEQGRRSITHFYRDCEVWPRLNPSVVLAPNQEVVQDSTSKNVFMGGTGEVHLTASLHRSTFVAGTQVPVNIMVANRTKKLIKSLTLTLYQSTTVFKSQLPINQGIVHRKPMSTSTLQMTQGFPRAHASSGGWWSGIPSGERSRLNHFLSIPPNAVSHTRERLVQVSHAVRVTLNCGTLGSDVSVNIPIRIINMISLDPPPSSFASLRSTSSVPDVQAAYEDDSDAVMHEMTGDLTMCDDAEDFVHHAIVAAQMDTAYPESNCDLDSLAESSMENEYPEEAENLDPNYSHSLRHRGPSAFATRVQEKLRDRQPLSPRISSTQVSIAEEDFSASISVSQSYCSSIGVEDSVVPGYQVATSSFLDHRYYATASTSVVGLPYTKEEDETPSGLGIATFRTTLAAPPTAVTVSPSVASPQRPPIVVGLSTGSVKDRIRELEARVRQAEAE